MDVTVARDWLDYVQALGSVAAVVIATVAAWFAAKSARDAVQSAEAATRTADAAERTADAAEETATASKQEAEHSQQLLNKMQTQLELHQEEHEILMAESKRRPEINPVLQVEKMEIEQPGVTSVTVKFGASNKGSKTAEQALLLLVAPRSVGMATCNLDGSNPQGIVATGQTFTVEANGDQVLTHSLNRNRDLRPQINEVDGARLEFPEPGHYEIQLRITHDSIEGGSLQVSETVTIPTVAAT